MIPACCMAAMHSQQSRLRLVTRDRVVRIFIPIRRDRNFRGLVAAAVLFTKQIPGCRERVTFMTINQLVQSGMMMVNSARLQFTILLFLGIVAAPAICSAQRPVANITRLSEILPDKPWPERRAEIERRWLGLLGDFPSEVPELRPEMKEVEHKDGITRYHVSFQAEADDRVTAWLLVPDTAKDKPTAAVVCVHSTTWGSGKDQVIGLSGRRPVDPPRDAQVGVDYGRTIAQHGFITLCIDLLTDGERIDPNHRVMDTRPFYLKHPEWSIVGKNTWDIMRSVDFLQTLDFVDHDHIGCTGWSLGGHTALFAAAFDKRITATVSNGGVLDWWRDATAWSREPTSWKPWQKGVDPPSSGGATAKKLGFQTNSGPYVYIKSFRPYIDDSTLQIPVDFDSLMAMVAPRPLLVISTEHEFYRHMFFPKAHEAMAVYVKWKDADGVSSVFDARKRRLGWDETLEYYDRRHNIKQDKMERQLGEFGAGDCFSWFSFPGGHAFPGVARRMTFAWLDRWLGRTMY